MTAVGSWRLLVTHERREPFLNSGGGGMRKRGRWRWQYIIIYLPRKKPATTAPAKGNATASVKARSWLDLLRAVIWRESQCAGGDHIAWPLLLMTTWRTWWQSFEGEGEDGSICQEVWAFLGVVGGSSNLVSVTISMTRRWHIFCWLVVVYAAIFQKSSLGSTLCMHCECHSTYLLLWSTLSWVLPCESYKFARSQQGTNMENVWKKNKNIRESVNSGEDRMYSESCDREPVEGECTMI